MVRREIAGASTAWRWGDWKSVGWHWIGSGKRRALRRSVRRTIRHAAREEARREIERWQSGVDEWIELAGLVALLLEKAGA